MCINLHLFNNPARLSVIPHFKEQHENTFEASLTHLAHKSYLSINTLNQESYGVSLLLPLPLQPTFLLPSSQGLISQSDYWSHALGACLVSPGSAASYISLLQKPSSDSLLFKSHWTNKPLGHGSHCHCFLALLSPLTTFIWHPLHHNIALCASSLYLVFSQPRAQAL